jgi:trk system potassium uptake protein TrkH
VIAHYLGTLVILLGVIMLVPLIISCALQEWETTPHYLIGFGLALAAGSLLRLARVSPAVLERRQAIAVTGLAWLVGALVASVPLWLSGHYGSFFDAFFDGVSGLTATGLTLIQDLDHLSTADNMWRFALQFLGGQGVVVIALSLGLFSKVGSSFYNAEGRDEFILPNIKKTAQFIWQFSSVVVLIGTVILTISALLLGIEPVRSVFHGLWITIGAYDTGGFTPQSTNIVYYHSWAFEIITMLLMLMGAINFAVYAQAWKSGWRVLFKDIEIRTLAIWITFLVVVFTAALCAGQYLTDINGLLRRGIFTIVSAATNSGYQVISTNQLTAMLTTGAFFMIAIAMAVGGSAGSTAGGIKALRVGLIAKGIIARVKGVLSPSSAHITASYHHVGRRLLSNELLSSAMIIASLYVVSYLVGALAGIAYGYEAIPATFESISAASNAGMSSGIAAPDAPVFIKITYIIQMWTGRLEFLTLLALLASFIASLRPRKRGVKA